MVDEGSSPTFPNSVLLCSNPAFTVCPRSGHELGNHMAIDAPCYNMSETEFEAGSRDAQSDLKF
jgi:hypothetical protein